MAKKKSVATKKAAVQTKGAPQRKAAPETKPVLDREFRDLLKAANAPDEAGSRASTIDSDVIGLFETALKTLKDAKYRVAQGQDITKEILNATEYLQFGISKLKAGSK